MYHPKNIIDVLADNIRKTRNPFGAGNSTMNKWWKDASLRTEGDALLFTGLMYQMMPYIKKTTHHIERFEDTKLADYVGYQKYVPKLLVKSAFVFMADKEDKVKFNHILQSMVKLLERSGVNFFYKPKLDYYSGILLYDLGDLEGFIEHARFVAEKLKKQGIRKIITVDPHTTYALKVLFPKYTGIEFDVKTYFELINFEAKDGGSQVTLHDPCFYGRYLKLSDVPRSILDKFGIENVGVRNSGTFTSCCGGPAESISPALTKEILQRRYADLQETGKPIVSMCPICLGNLLKIGADVEDLSVLLARYA
ncbi:MAG: (Fe-S)-binding protein [Desulfobacterales bacterium]|nr:(Fe-S)-binding protein [Desulfobacterales bacterium]MBL7173193.1 (Fe-S)-binding protein [Desulfobacteraceae bacterium]